MPQRTDSFDLGGLGLTTGEGRRLDLHAGHDPLLLSGQRYTVEPLSLPVTLDVSRMTAGGYALRLRFEARVAGPCMRCLAAADPIVAVDAREVDQPGGGEELDSPYVSQAELDLRGWVRDALALALPSQLVCREDCAGLCPVCGEDLNLAGGDHGHEREPDPRWAKLRELRLE
ncbi:MAG TPA: DUF177 domain-containing protein [Solirubrobacteraceae bacterium]|nr:DUF177 domain-containing protein [Solirubrobacteraceae bacterium]